MDVIESLKAVLSTPIAKRKGVTFSPEECRIWVEEMEKVDIKVRQKL